MVNNSKITLYSTQSCPNCSKIKEILDENNINYNLVQDIDLIKSKGIKYVPVLEFNDKYYSYDDVLENINYFKPVDGRKLMSDSKFYEGYSRFDEEKQRYETWDESIERVMNMHRTFYKDKITPELSSLLDEVENAYKDKLFLGSQRALQFGGEQLLNKHARLYNCCASYCDRPNFFGGLFYLLLCGCGVGFSVQKHHIKSLPKIKKRGITAKTYVVPDSIEGWASTIDVLLSSYFVENSVYPEYKGKKVYFDLSNIRPKGSYISGGFKAPGAEPLRKALNLIEDLIEKEVKNGENRLKSIVLYDICMYISDAVLSGGIRRSATICMFSKDDKDMLNAKTGSWFIDNPQRSRSNNSVVLLRDETTLEEFKEIIKSVKDFGEPGFIWTDSNDFVYNPCFTGDMKLLTDYGYKTFEELCDKEVSVYNINGNVTKGKVWFTGKKETIKLNLSNKKSIMCTPNHVFMTDNKEEVKAKDLLGKKLINIIPDTDNDFDKKYISLGNECKCDDEFPKFYETLSRKNKLSFLRGIFSKNGNVIFNKGIVCLTKNKTFVEDLKSNLIEFGITSKIIFNEETYSLFIYNQTSLDIFYKYISFSQKHKVRDLKSLIESKIPTVLSIENKGIQKVYDFTEPETHWGYVNGVVVHNCVEVGMKPITKDGRTGYQACVSGDTKLITKDGIVDIKTASDNHEEVSIWNGKEYKKVIPFKTGENEKLYRVSFNDGSYLDTTKNHRFLVKNRFQKDYKIVETIDLIELLKTSKYNLQIPRANFIMDNNVGNKYDMAYNYGLIFGDVCNLSKKIDNKKFYDLKHENGIPQWVFELNKESVLEFIAGWADSDGSQALKGIRIYGEEHKIRDGQLLLTKLGINSSVNFKRNVWYLQITKTIDIPCRRLVCNNNKESKFKSKNQIINSIVELDGIHNSYCLHEPETQQCVFNNVLTMQCNLTEINGSKSTTKEIFFNQCKYASILGTLQAGYTDFGYLKDATKEIVEKEALIGVGITGMMNNPDTLFDEDITNQGAEIVKYWNKKVSKMIGINQAARTTVIKPSGNSAVLLECSSGIHGEHAPTYLRHVQFNKDTEVAKLFMKENPNMCEDSVWNKERDVVVAFPIETSDKSVYKKDLLGVKQLEYVKNTQQNWIKNGTNLELCTDEKLRHNVSNTITVDDWDEVTNYIYDNRKYLCGVSLLSALGDKAYPQAPFTEVFSTKDIVERYGEVSLFTSALIESGLQAFNNDLWNACNTALGHGESLTDDHKDLLKRDFIRRFNKFSNNFKDKEECTNCLKDVYNSHKMWKIKNNIKNINWVKELNKKSFVDIDTMGATGCAGGKCEV